MTIYTTNFDVLIGGAKLSFGSHKKGGGLFPKRKDGDNWLPDRGWGQGNPKTEKNE